MNRPSLLQGGSAVAIYDGHERWLYFQFQTTTSAMNKIAIILFAVLLSGCRTLPPQYSASPSRCLVQGISTAEPVKKDTFGHLMFGMLDPNDPTPVTSHRPSWTTEALICSIDGGDLLSVRKVWLEPGVYKLSVMCSTSYSWGTLSRCTDLDLDVQPSYTYFLAASQLKSISDVPHIEVTKEESK
jgi:hypothetical protein